MPDSPRTAKAIAVHLHNAAVRALDDPVALARAARIVKVALERERLTLADIVPEPAADSQAAHE